MLNRLKPYNKLIVALLGAVFTVLLQFYGNSDWLQALVPVLTAAGVYQVKNEKAL